MNKQVIFQTCIISEKLTDLEMLALKSLRNVGYEIHLYTYYHIECIPEGVLLKPAEQVIVPQDIFADEDGSFQTFSELFKFKLLNQYGGWWIDLDIIWLKAIDTFQPYHFSSNYKADDSSAIVINTKLLKVPPKDNFTSSMLDYIDQLKKNEITVRRIKSFFIKMIFKHHLHEFIAAPERYFPIPEVTDNSVFKAPPTLQECYAAALWKNHWPVAGLHDKAINPAWLDLFNQISTSVKNVDYVGSPSPVVKEYKKQEEKVTVIINADIQSPEDVFYYRSLLSLLTSFANLSVYLLECGFKPELDQKLAVYYLFTKRQDEIQNQKLKINEILNSIADTAVCLWLNKCYISKEQFITGNNFICNYNIDICFPYNEVFFIDDILNYVFEKEFDFDFLKAACSKMYKRNINLFEGGVFFVNRETYLKYGAENTGLTTPFFCDIDRIIRIKKEGRTAFLKGAQYSLDTSKSFKPRGYESQIDKDYSTIFSHLAG